jgi:lipopolysaccharide/colanic/teichoic acid biosynthesis glycosyltransferase
MTTPDGESARPDPGPWPATPRNAPRWFDLALGIVGIVGSSPIIAGAAVATRLAGDRGPLLYRATRIGEGGRPIVVFKLRTMAVASSGPAITRTGDPRITPVGRFLRRSKIDELPQLINVVRGEMSLVGPRPEDPMYLDWEDPLHRFVFSARPGITGPSQIAFRHEERLLEVPDPEHLYRTEILPAKLALDAEYLVRRSVVSDIGILAETIRAVFKRSGDG